MQEVIQIVGLGIIVAAWAMQLTSVLQRRLELNRLFVAIYTVGVVIFTIGNAARGLDFVATLNIASAVLSGLIFLKLPKNL